VSIAYFGRNDKESVKRVCVKNKKKTQFSLIKNYKSNTDK